MDARELFIAPYFSSAREFESHFQLALILTIFRVVLFFLSFRNVLKPLLMLKPCANVGEKFAEQSNSWCIEGPCFILLSG